MADLLNNNYPVSLYYNTDLVERVCARYPLVDKSTVSLTVKYIFKAVRELLVLGRVLNVKPLFWRMRLWFFTHGANKKVFSKKFAVLKVKMETYWEIKKS